MPKPAATISTIVDKLEAPKVLTMSTCWSWQYDNADNVTTTNNVSDKCGKLVFFHSSTARKKSVLRGEYRLPAECVEIAPPKKPKPKK